MNESCDCGCYCTAPGRPDDDGTPGSCDPCRMGIHQLPEFHIKNFRPDGWKG